MVRVHSPESVDGGAASVSSDLRAPQGKWRLLRNPFEVGVRREHQKFVSNAELGIEHADRSHLHAMSPTYISQLSGINVVSPVRYHQGESGEPGRNGHCRPGSKGLQVAKNRRSFPSECPLQPIGGAIIGRSIPRAELSDDASAHRGCAVLSELFVVLVDAKLK